MKVFFIQKNPYCKGYVPQISDIIRLYNNTYIITSKNDDVYDLKDICSGSIVSYSLRRRPFELLLSQSCKDDICKKKSLSKSIVPNYLDNIPQESQPILNTPINNSSYSIPLPYCSIM